MDERRFAILHHTGIDRPHFDVLIELQAGGALSSWRSPVWPIDADTRLDRLSDHRREYLEYEGPVSGGRGAVGRVLGGVCRVDSASTNAAAVGDLNGEFSLEFIDSSLAPLRFFEIAPGQWYASPISRAYNRPL